MPIYQPETAGALRNVAVPIATSTETVAEVQERLQQRASDWETISYIYVLNDRSQLRGVVSIKELLRAEGELPLEDICIHSPISVSPETDREVVAHLALEHNIKAVPVLNENKEFLGIVDTDTILDTLFEESSEDLARLAGVSPEMTQWTAAQQSESAWQQVRGRAPYLLLGLAGGLIAAVTVGQYEAVLEEHIMVAAFIPLVVYLADAVGSQIQIIFIRALSLSKTFSLYQYITREVLINTALGALLSVVVAVVAWFWLGDLSLVLLLLGAVFTTTLAALAIALLLPLILRSLGKDPALGSGPLATVCIDITSLVVYFLLASWLLL